MSLRIPTLLLGAVLAAGAALPSMAAPPPLPLPVVPDAAQDRLQAQIAAQQAQAQSTLAASQAKVQAMLDANQARLQGQVHAEQQAQLGAARHGPASSSVWAPSPALSAWPPQDGPVGTLRLITLTPQLGRYFGAARGVLVVRAPRHGVLKLQDGDVILAIGGRVPASSSQAIRILTSYDPGEKIGMVIMREHHRVDITATLPAAPAEF